jgi:hypothetical protein
MAYMFYKAVSFNQPVGTWNVDNVAHFFFMFDGAASFNQPLLQWI